MVPYHGGALLPTEQRYTSPIFRRLHRIDRAHWLTLDEAAELVGFIRLVGLSAAGRMFEWNRLRRKQAELLTLHGPLQAAADAYEQANLAALDEETGIAVMQVLIERGWRHGAPPEICKMAMRSMRDRGMTHQQIADFFGYPVTIDRVNPWITPRKKKDDGRVRAVAALAIG